MALSNNSAGEEGLGEGGALRQELSAILPGADASEIDRILSHYSATMIRTAIERVARTPERNIRKSKAALFRFLLTRFSQDIDANDL